MVLEVDVISTRRIAIDGYLYVYSREVSGTTYWDCKKVRDKVCKARACTKIIDGTVTVMKGPETSRHAHPPNHDEVAAEKIKFRVKARATERATPAVILQGICFSCASVVICDYIMPISIAEELAGASGRVLCHLPERENLKKAIRRKKRKDLPPNPNSLDELDDIPENLQVTSIGDRFLIYDSNDTEDLENGRVLVFATRRNLELLNSSQMWYLDGTFKVSPSIFTQVFTVLGTYNRNPNDPQSQAVAFPYAYCLLSSKETVQYTAALQAVLSAVQEYGIDLEPREVMSDFELAITNTVRDIFPDTRLLLCFYHLSQALYRKIQKLGLQTAYNNRDNTCVKDYTHMTAALAFVPVGDVARCFRLLKAAAPQNMAAFMKYFEENYVTGVAAHGRRRAVPPRYPPELWNQYVSTLTDQSRTNNASEGWHNRFHLLVGRDHPDIFSIIKDFQKEQGDTEIQIMELSLGRRVKAAPKKAWTDTQKRMKKIVESYEQYGIARYAEYLERIACNIVISGN